MLTLRPGTPVVLPSPNGATIAIEAAARGVPFVLAGCLRNATATARRARTLAHDGAIGVIAAGERHVESSGGGAVDEHPIRFAVEDLIGAGAVLHAIDPAGSIGPPCCSPEARAARAAFLDARPDLHQMLITCGSGRELAGRTCVDDVTTAAEHDATRLAAQLIDGRFIGV
jgi:2-phosphosulfolactate phosphatase